MQWKKLAVIIMLMLIGAWVVNTWVCRSVTKQDIIRLQAEGAYEIPLLLVEIDIRITNMTPNALGVLSRWLINIPINSST